MVQLAGGALLTLLTGCGALGSSAPVLEHDAIRAADLQAHVDVLASDAFEGREAGTDGEKLAREYIIAQLSRLESIVPAGTDGGWLQPFPMPAHAGGGTAHNILALLPGGDPELSQQVIIVGAHYDHVGFGLHGNSLAGLTDGPSIHNGADDNASGTAALLELAASLATRTQGPRRSVLFQWYSGEELGLLGSLHWCAQPTLPLESVLAMLNMDMVGRLTGSTLMVGGVGTAPGLEPLVRAAAEPEQLELIIDPSGAAPSDNASFHLAGVPALFVFTGLHDDYHRPSDDAHKLNADGAARVARMVSSILDSLDALAEPPGFTAAPGSPALFTPRAWLGLALTDVPAWVPGVAVVEVVVDDGPAAAAGLLAGDVLFKVGGSRPSDRAAAVAALSVLDDRRTPHSLSVWRSSNGALPDEDDEWLDVMELVQLSLRPAVR